jgi:hypothetical protein
MPLGFFKGVGGLGRRLAPGLQFVTATGGTVTDVTIGGLNYRIHQFTSNGTFSVSSPGEVGALIVGGGGGANSAFPGQPGGGGGGVVEQASILVTAQNYSITVGAGGLTVYNGTAGTGGGSSSALGYTAGGGAAATSQGQEEGCRSGSPQSFEGASTTYFGNQDYRPSGGGGGAGGRPNPTNVAYNTATAVAGPGLLTSFTGTATYFSAGGRGRGANTSGQPSYSNGTGWSDTGYGHGAPSTNINSGTQLNSRPGVVYIKYRIA